MEVEADKVRLLFKRETTQKQKKVMAARPAASLLGHTNKHEAVCVQEGLSKLDVLLDSAEFKHVLDVNTAKLWPEDQLRGAPQQLACSTTTAAAQPTAIIRRSSIISTASGERIHG
jgi:hypothetical protein